MIYKSLQFTSAFKIYKYACMGEYTLKQRLGILALFSNIYICVFSKWNMESKSSKNNSEKEAGKAKSSEQESPEIKTPESQQLSYKLKPGMPKTPNTQGMPKMPEITDEQRKEMEKTKQKL